MREAYLIDALSESLGKRIRKEPVPGTLDLVAGLLANIDFIGAEQRFDGLGIEDASALYAADERGNVCAVLLESVNPSQLPLIVSLQHVRTVLLVDTEVDPEGAQALAKLPELEFLALEIGKNGNEVLRLVGQIETLKSLIIGSTQEAGDISPLQELPELTSLVADGCANLKSLLKFPSLTHLYTSLPDDPSFLSRLDRLESLGFGRVEGSVDADFSFLREMGSLRRLIAEVVEIPLSVLQCLPKLQGLATKYPHTSLEPLAAMEHLESLQLKNSRLTELSTLVGFKQLKRLDLKDGSLVDLTHLRGQASLELLDISGNPISKLPDQLAMPGLKHLSWSGRAPGTLSDGSFLEQCSQLTSLKLDNHRLADVEFLRSLGNLRHVDLSDNAIEEISAVAELPNLTAIDISGNKVRSLAPLVNCSALTTLIAGGNPVEDVEVLSRVRSLERLKLVQAGVADLAFIKRLRSLFELDAANNQIRSMEPLVELPNLVKIDLGSNAITQISAEILDRQGLESLRLTGNPLEGISPELFSGDGKQTVSMLRNYYRGLARGRVKHDQAKLLLVGNGRVGKTSVVDRILDDAFDPDQPSTHGIQLRKWQLDDVAQDKLDGQPLKVDVWDFGGQDIYHATHRLFMKTRALFLLVWDQETESARYSMDELGQRYENFRLPYWIDYIKALSGSPVIIVQNKVDRGGKDPTYGLELRTVYPPPTGIVDYQYVSAKRELRNGMAGLRESIALAMEKIAEVGYELPAQWVEVRDRLLAMTHRYVDFELFSQICEAEGMGAGEDESLAGFLHQIGAVFYQPDNFGKRLILDQRWAIEAVYTLFDRRDGAYSDLKIAGRHGVTLDLLKRMVWRHFSVDEHQLLLEFMKSCEICFEFSQGVFYVPQLLPDETPVRVKRRWPELTEYCLQIDYPFLHRAIIDRFLVQTGLLGADDEPEIWRNGIVIYDADSRTEALVAASPADNRIHVSAKGETPVEMLQMVRRKFDELHGEFPATAACSADGGQSFVELETLHKYAQAGSSRVPSLNGDLSELAPLKVFLDARQRALPQGKLKVKDPKAVSGGAAKEIFLSYAWGDAAEKGENRQTLVDRLHDSLAAKNYKVIRDKKDHTYRMVISDFMRRMGDGDLVVVVISDAYLKSPYCMFELLEIYENGKFHEHVLPLMLADTNLDELPDQLRYVFHWKQEKKRIERLIEERGLDAFDSDSDYRAYDLYYRRIFSNFDKLTPILSAWNALTPSLLEEDSLAQVLEAVESKIAGQATPDRARIPVSPATDQVEDNKIVPARDAPVSSGDARPVRSVFISYSSDDRGIANKVKRFLTDRGISVRIDTKSLDPGRKLAPSIVKLVCDTDVTLSIVSKKSLLSDWVAMETMHSFYRAAHTGGKKFISGFIDDDFLDLSFRVTATKKIDSEIGKINELIPQHNELRIDTNDLNDKKTRLIKLRNNLGEILRHLRGSLCVDIRGDAFEAGMTRIVNEIGTASP